LAVSVANAINPTLYLRLNYDQIRDFVPVASIDVVPNVMDINRSCRSGPSLSSSHAKANPGTISMGSGGINSSPHVAGRAVQDDDRRRHAACAIAASRRRLPICWPGGCRCCSTPCRHRLRTSAPASCALAVTSRKRRRAAGGAGDERIRAGLRGGFVPRHRRAARHAAADRRPDQPRDQPALADARLKARLADLGAEVLTGTPEDFGRYLAQEIDKWGKVVKFSGAKAE
jgi:hypothetical protein